MASHPLGHRGSGDEGRESQGCRIFYHPAAASDLSRYHTSWVSPPELLALKLEYSLLRVASTQPILQNMCTPFMTASAVWKTSKKKSTPSSPTTLRTKAVIL
ncbi:hypothetical protein I314_02260 [Cryptococcus bacillisporus CA1873]|uniref:Uncharacterized protein n=1 Tax=Cryptococcus bacillisporus CA1873 TaxID=1296111 RepID=A0ABR5BCZ9_CRYGA|nr:hypothetical protein I314_02260 [Cryptococcus bacillisporus CA1873]|eukprot:KIR67047.1 hypothetical protein I314_02260 [Cryptococcus gattii CA1873]